MRFLPRLVRDLEGWYNFRQLRMHSGSGSVNSAESLKLTVLVRTTLFELMVWTAEIHTLDRSIFFFRYNAS